MSRQDQYNCTVSVTRNNETRNLGTWDKHEGGEVDSEETKYRPGGMADEIVLGGYRTVGNVTVSRLFKLDRDLPNEQWLMSGVGIADVVITKQSLDVNKNPFGSPRVYRGRLKAYTPPDHDSESSEAALVSLEITNATVS